MVIQLLVLRLTSDYTVSVYQPYFTIYDGNWLIIQDFISRITFIEDYCALKTATRLVPPEITHCYEMGGHDGIFCLDGGRVIASGRVTT